MVTPIQLLRKIAAGKKNYYLLESVEGREMGTVFVPGYDPVMRVSCRENTVTIKQKTGDKTVDRQYFFRILDV